MDFFDSLGSLALGSRLKRLSDVLMAETRTIYRAEGMDFEPRWFPIFFLLQERGEITVMEAASSIDIPHTYVSQLVKEMRHAKLVRFKRHPDDGRSRLVALTAEGAELVGILKPLWKDIQDAVDTIIQGTHADVIDILKRMERLLVETPTSMLVKTKRHGWTAHTDTAPVSSTGPFYIRRIERNDEPVIASIIRTVMTEMGASGPGLSIHDAEVDHMFDAYATKRAQYFVAVYNGRVVGGCGLAPLVGGDPTICELRKMFILSDVRGLGIGQALLASNLDAAGSLGYTQCYLETLRSMTRAHHLYEQAGFTKISGPLGNTGHFSCDVFYLKDVEPPLLAG